jgi:hypothetical protein
MCRCGSHPKAFLNTAPSLSTMTTHDIMDLLEKQGYKQCEIRDEGTGRITIITPYKVQTSTQQQIEASMPAGVMVTFVTTAPYTMYAPPSLEKWFKEAKRYMK